MDKKTVYFSLSTTSKSEVFFHCSVEEEEEEEDKEIRVLELTLSFSGVSVDKNKIRYTTFREMVGTTPIVQYLEQLRVKWSGHLSRLPIRTMQQSEE